jgi:hypothetical protein
LPDETGAYLSDEERLFDSIFISSANTLSDTGEPEQVANRNEDSNSSNSGGDGEDSDEYGRLPEGRAALEVFLDTEETTGDSTEDRDQILGDILDDRLDLIGLLDCLYI